MSKTVVHLTHDLTRLSSSWKVVLSGARAAGVLVKPSLAPPFRRPGWALVRREPCPWLPPVYLAPRVFRRHWPARLTSSSWLAWERAV